VIHRYIVRHPLLSLTLAITAFVSTAVAAPPDYKLIVGHWRVHVSRRADRIVIFHADGTWGVRNWDFSQPEDIQGRRRRVAGDRLILTYPSDHGFTTYAEKIVSFTRARFMTETASGRFYYTRLKHWPPKSPNQTMQPNRESFRSS
jgi:hypothetical protein